MLLWFRKVKSVKSSTFLSFVESTTSLFYRLICSLLSFSNLQILHLHGLDEHHDSQLCHQFGRILLLGLLGLDEHHDSQLRHQFGRWLLL